MDIAFDDLDAGDFLLIWRHFDADDNGYIEGKELDDFFRHMMMKLRPGEEITEDKVQQLKRRFMSAYDLTADGRLQIHELANMILPEDENFLLLFRRETPLDNSVEFMKIWRKYDMDRSGFISAVELKSFLKDLIVQHKKAVSPSKLDKYTETMDPRQSMFFLPPSTLLLGGSKNVNFLCIPKDQVGKTDLEDKMNIFDRNKDGQLDLNDLARILALQENFLLQFKIDASSQEERKRDFEKIFAHYDVSKTGALEGPEVDGFVKDMMELVKPSIGATDLDKFRQVLLCHCDMNRDGKIQKSELALCLGIKFKP